MKQLKIRILLVVIFLISTIFILTFNLSAQEREKKRGYQGPILKETMLSKFSKGEIVEGYVIKGDDIIEIIKKTDYKIRIEDSIIEGGLDFTELAVPLEKRNLPKDWNEKEKEAFIDKWYVDDIPLVKNKIEIINSDIKYNIRNFYSIDAGGTLFTDGIDFVEVTFSGPAYFVDSTFNRKVDFRWSTFSGQAHFEDSTFSRKADFRWSTFSREVRFTGATFSGVADFSEAKFENSVYFIDTNFSGWTSFIMATFSGPARFALATFSGVADFSVATFNKLAWFLRVSFFESLIIKYTLFKEYADFRESRIKRLNCNNVESPTIVGGRIDFRGATISEAHFQDIIFEKDVDFSDSKFGVVFVKLDKLPQGLEFPDSLKDKMHYVAEAKLLFFTGRMTEKEKEILIRLTEDAQYKTAVEQLFRESTLGPFAVVFRFVTFESDAYFLRAKFFGDTALERVTFKKEVNFTDADLKSKKNDNNHNFSLSYLNFNNLLIKWDQLPNLKSWVSETRIKSFIDIEEEEDKEKGKQEGKDEEADEVKKKEEKEVELEPLYQVLKGLEANFRNQKQLSDANNAYYFKKKEEFKEEKKRNSKAFWKWFPRQAWKIWRLSCGYGTKILWILGWIIFIDLFFAMIYSFKNNLDKKIHPETEREFVFKQRLFDFPRLYLSEAKPLDMIKSKFAIKFINALRFSSVILLKVGYRDTKISGKILGIDCKYFVWFEWLLGFYLLACLTVTMSNTVPIINRLISGMF